MFQRKQHAYSCHQIYHDDISNHHIDYIILMAKFQNHCIVFWGTWLAFDQSAYFRRLVNEDRRCFFSHLILCWKRVLESTIKWSIINQLQKQINWINILLYPWCFPGLPIPLRNILLMHSTTIRILTWIYRSSYGP